MVSFRRLHSHLKLLSNNDLKSTRTEEGFKRAFATLFRQDVEIFTGTMFLNVDQLEKQLDKEEFQEIESMADFKVLETQFQKFIKSRTYLDDEHVKSIDKRALHKREYDSRVIERQMQTTEEEVDTSKALNASLVNTKSSGTESGEQYTSSRSGNDAHADDADIRPIYDEEPMAENAKQYHDTCPLPAKLTDNQITELLYQSLESKNICLKKTIAQATESSFNEKSNEAKVKHDIDVIETINIKLEHKVATLLKESETLKRNYKEMSDSIKKTRAKTIQDTTSLIAQNVEFKGQLQEKGFTIAALKNELRKLTRNSVNTKFARTSILGKPVLQPHRNQSVVRQPTTFKSERPRISKPQFASQVDVNNDLSKLVTTHYLPKERESAVVKTYHMIAPSSSRYNLNDMVHNHYLKEAKKKTQESGRNSRPSVMPSARLQSTANGSKPKPRINNQKSRNWPTSKSSCVTTKTVSIADHFRNSNNFSDSKHFVCLTCQKCVFNANHDQCVTKFLNEVNSRAKVPSHKTTNKNKPEKQISVAKKPERQIPTGHRFSIKKTSIVLTGNIFTSSTTKVDSEPPHGFNTDITNLQECIQTLDSSAGTSINVQEEQNLDLSACTPFNLKKERIKTWTKDNVIYGRRRLHGIASLQEISAKPSSQGIRSLLTS
ncbi:hypothetical protein Tco_1293343 [Tanacetum coccineum]